MYSAVPRSLKRFSSTVHPGVRSSWRGWNVGSRPASLVRLRSFSFRRIPDRNIRIRASPKERTVVLISLACSDMPKMAESTAQKNSLHSVICQISLLYKGIESLSSPDASLCALKVLLQSIRLHGVSHTHRRSGLSSVSRGCSRLLLLPENHPPRYPPRLSSGALVGRGSCTRGA